MIKNIRHIGIVISDITKSMDFYTNFLGFREIKTLDEGGLYIDELLQLEKSDIKTIKLKNNYNQVIELLFFRNPESTYVQKTLNNFGLTHFAISVDNVSRLHQNFKDRGVVFLSEPKNSPDGYAKVVFCKDPDGVFIELVEVMQ